MTHHGAGLLQLTEDKKLVEQLKQDYRKANLGEGDRAMLDYAVKLTIEPAKMEEADVITLRQVGFTDSAILDINQITAYYAFVNRLADGLGVELEASWEQHKP